MTVHYCHVTGKTQFGRKQSEDGYPITMLYFFLHLMQIAVENMNEYSPLEEQAVIFFFFMVLITHAINFICGRSMSKSV